LELKFYIIGAANCYWYIFSYEYVPSFDLAFLSVNILCVMLIMVV